MQASYQKEIFTEHTNGSATKMKQMEAIHMLEAVTPRLNDYPDIMNAS